MGKIIMFNSQESIRTNEIQSNVGLGEGSRTEAENKVRATKHCTLLDFWILNVLSILIMVNCFIYQEFFPRLLSEFNW